MTNRTVSVDELRQLIGKDLEPSPWVLLDQQRISDFADVTEDQQFIHVDPDKAKATPFGGTIAHGLLTLSMLPSLIEKTLPALEVHEGQHQLWLQKGSFPGSRAQRQTHSHQVRDRGLQ